MPKTRINDINVYYEVHGDGEPLLLIHGLAARGAGFARQIPALSQCFRVISFDNRGVGETDQPDDAYSIGQMADDAAGLLDALGVESAHVFGVSMGGMIAQELTLRRPGRVRKLALGCTHSGIKHCAPSPQWVTDIFKTLPGKPRRQAVRECVPFNFSRHTQEHNRRLIDVELERMVDNRQSLQAYINQINAVYAFDAFDRLPGIHAPTLILTGTDDALIPPANSHDLAARIPGASLIEFEQAGHLFFVEKADEVNNALISFFAQP